VPRYFFHIFDDESFTDHDGREFVNDAAALHQGLLDSRSMAARCVLDGRLMLDRRIEVTSLDGRTLGTIRCRDVVKAQIREPE
jgi:hypothetical protein